MNNVTFRPAKPEDAEKLFEIKKTAYGDEFKLFNYEEHGYKDAVNDCNSDDPKEDVNNLQKNTDLVEVIYPTLDGNIYFLDLSDGNQTRDPIEIGYSTKGTGMIDPRGYPILYTGQGLNQNGDEFAHHKYRIFSLIDQSEIYSITGTTPEAFRIWGAFDPSGLLDKNIL